MDETWLRGTAPLYWGSFIAAFVVFGLWETYRPAAPLRGSALRRWTVHGALLVIGSVLVSVVFRTSTVLVARSAADTPVGLWQSAHLPDWLRFAGAFLLLDLTRYATHRLMHSLPPLWRVHMVHHADAEFDWSTGIRFHPIETVVSYGVQLLVILIVAPPVWAVLASDLAGLIETQFSHTNVALASWIDRRLRRVLITPHLHSVHHSDNVDDQNTNFGTIFPWWDRLFGTYRDEPLAGREQFVLGLREVTPAEGGGLIPMLLLPFRRHARNS